MSNSVVMLLDVVFTIRAMGLDWPVIELASMIRFGLMEMLLSTYLRTQWLGRIKVVEPLSKL